MNKYADLNQAIQDQSLVIITEDISEQNELNKAYIRYRTLPKWQKRFSDYYSNKFLGHNVSEMYELVKDQLRTDSPLLEDLPLPSETYVHSEPDLYYKEDEFNSGKTNICFILGHSGSGKSSMAKILEGEDIDHIELDDLLLIKDHFSMDQLKDYSDMLYSFISTVGAKYYIGFAERDSMPKEEYEDKVFIDFISFATDYAKKHKEKKYIIEGIWIYLYFDDPSLFKDYAVFIKGTSFLKSKIRVMKREIHRDAQELQDRKQMFGRETRNYLLDEEKINSYREYYSALPETVFREENGEEEAKEKAVLSELNRINELYVNEDANSILEILKAAKADSTLSAINRIRIVGECQSAIFDLIRMATEG